MSQVGQIFLVYRDEVVTELTKSMLSSKGINVYCLNEVNENIAYIINDLSPELVLVDEKVYEKSSDYLNCAYNDDKTSSKWALLSEEDNNENNPFELSMKLPLKAKTLYEDITSLI